MRKILPALLAVALLCTLCACGGQSQPTAPADQSAAEPVIPDPQPESQAPVESVPALDPVPEAPAPQEEPSEAPEETAPAEKPAAPADKQPDALADKPAEEPAQQPAAPEPEKPAETPAKPAGDPKTIAQGLVGRPVSELYDAIGKPLSSDYAPSCLIDGDDGELTYDGFVVYTERGEGYETVYAVM